MAQTQINGAQQIRAATIPWDRMASGAIVPTASLVDGASFLKADASVNMTADFNLNSHKIIGMSDPVSATDGVNKRYVDASINGFKIHGARVLKDANQAALSGLPTVDGVTLVDSDVVLLTAQTTGSQNGPWLVHSGAWTRPTWWAAASTITEGNLFIIDPDGTTYKNSKWYVQNTGNITVDTTAVTFTQDTSGSSYTALTSSGLALTGSQFSITAGNGISASANALVAVGESARLITVGSSGIGITNGTAGQIIVAAVTTGNATWRTMSGDVTIDNVGATAVNHTAGSGFLKYTDFVYNETPGGTINGSNTAFTVASTPQNSSLELVLNGVVLEPGAGNDYTVSGTSITMLFAPATGDKLRAYYVK
jgi:hypothetical protein